MDNLLKPHFKYINGIWYMFIDRTLDEWLGYGNSVHVAYNRYIYNNYHALSHRLIRYESYRGPK